MKKINLKEIAKKIQSNYRSSIKKELDRAIKYLDHSSHFRNNKEARVSILGKLEECTNVSGKMPIIDNEDIFNILAPFHLDEYIEDKIAALIKTRVPTIDNIYKDLHFLKKEFKGVSFKSNTLTVRTDDVILEDINFGPFYIYLDTSNDLFIEPDDVYVEVEAITPNFPSGCSSHPHPHVEDGHLCVGDGQSAISASMRDMRILDYFCIINAILNTYGSGPYEDISAWSNDACTDCGARYYPDDMSSCDRCGEIFCNDCISECESCGNYYCGFCVKNNCGNCGSRVCDDCMTKCVVCGEVCCDNCIESSCCGPACTDNCCESCNVCGTTVCNSCIIVCHICGHTCCQDCASECKKCKEYVCDECREECDECESSCHDGCECEC